LPEHQPLKTFAIGGGILVASALLVGFLIDAEGFLGNLLAEVVGLVVGILIALFVIEKAVEADRNRRWESVSEQTLKTLRLVVIRAGMDIYLQLPAPRSSAADPYSMGMAGDAMLSGALERLAELVRAEHSIADGESIEADLAAHLEVIRTAVTPSLLALDKPLLIAPIMAVEGAVLDLAHANWLYARFGGPNQVPEELSKVVAALAAIADAIDDPETGA
jgi:hypothetical protein